MLPDISDQQLIADYFHRLKRDPSVLVPLSSHMIRSLLASIYEALGYPMRFVLYLTGVQGSGKTTAANDFALPMTCLSNHAPAPSARALASKPSVRDFTAEYRDMPVLLDDVCTSSGSETRRASTEVAAYTLRFVTDHIPELLKPPGGKQRSVRCNAGVIITGEFPMTAPSDLTRCVIVDVDHQMRNKEADDRAVTSAVALRFLQYVAANYDAICEKIRSGLGAFRADQAKDSRPRQQQHLAELSCSFQLLLEYAREIGAIQMDAYGDWCTRLQNILNHSLGVTNRLIEEYERKNITNISRIIIESLYNGSLTLAKSQKRFQQDPDQFDGFSNKKKGQIYLRLKSLSQLLTTLSGRTWTEQAVGALLRENGLVEIGKDKHTAKAKFPKIGRLVPLDKNVLRKQAYPTEKS